MSTEQSFPYNGPLSTFSEWHSLTIGLAAGLLIGWSKTLRRDLKAEPHYAIGGLLVGAVVAFVLQQWGD